MYDRFRRQAAQPVLAIDGVVQSQDDVWSLLAFAITPVETGPGGSPRSHDYY